MLFRVSKEIRLKFAHQKLHSWYFECAASISLESEPARELNRSDPWSAGYQSNGFLCFQCHSGRVGAGWIPKNDDFG